MNTRGKDTGSLEELVRKLADEALMNGIEIFEFQIGYLKNEIKIRVLLDKMNHPLGSVTIEECEEYTHLYRMKLDSHLSEDDQYRYSLEVSSAGAEREVRLPEELKRFQNQLMKVSYDHEGKSRNIVMHFIRGDQTETYWKYAKVKYNRNQGINLKNTQNEIMIPMEDIIKVNLYLDF